MRSSLLLLAAAAGMVSAQITSSCTTPTSTISDGAMATITQTYTSTYCPACEEVTTTYETAYATFCPSGTAPATYTCTETCAPDSCRTGLPPGFTTVEAVCTSCGATPITATLTQPCTECAEATVTSEYETVYQTFCPESSGLAPATYTVTASCAASPCPAPAAESVPQGFTTTVSTCTECGETPVTATLTYPVSAAAAASAGGSAAAAGGSAAAAAAGGSAGTVAGTVASAEGTPAPEGAVASAENYAPGASGTVVGASTGVQPAIETYSGNAASSNHHVGVYAVAGVAALAAYAKIF